MSGENLESRSPQGRGGVEFQTGVFHWSCVGRDKPGTWFGIKLCWKEQAKCTDADISTHTTTCTHTYKFVVFTDFTLLIHGTYVCSHFLVVRCRGFTTKMRFTQSENLLCTLWSQCTRIEMFLKPIPAAQEGFFFTWHVRVQTRYQRGQVNPACPKGQVFSPVSSGKRLNAVTQRLRLGLTQCYNPIHQGDGVPPLSTQSF